MTDQASQRYYRVDLDFWHKATCQRLLDDLGPWGPCVWLSLIAEAKRSSVPGVLIVTSMEALQDRLGFIEYELPFTLEAFLTLTGKLKQTSRTRVGRLLHVVLTHYPTWQRDWERQGERDKKNRWRSQQSDVDTAVDSKVDTPGDNPVDRDLDLVLDKDLDLGSSTTQDRATTPVANGTSKQTRQAETMIRNGGHGLTAYSLNDELERLHVPEPERPRLRAMAEELNAAAATSLRPTNAGDLEA